jgi:hypothetical protein
MVVAPLTTGSIHDLQKGGGEGKTIEAAAMLVVDEFPTS